MIASGRVRGEASGSKQAPGKMRCGLSRLRRRRFGSRVACERQPVERPPRDRRGIQRHRKLELMSEPRSVEGGEYFVRAAIWFHDLARSGRVRRAGGYQRHRAEGLRDASVAFTAVRGEVGRDVHCPGLHLPGHRRNDVLRPAGADRECSAQTPQLAVQRSQRLQEIPQPWLAAVRTSTSSNTKRAVSGLWRAACASAGWSESRRSLRNHSTTGSRPSSAGLIVQPSQHGFATPSCWRGGPAHRSPGPR